MVKRKPVKLSKKDLLRVTEHAPDVICRFDSEFRLLYVNPAIEVATGIPVNAFINKTTRELGMPEEHSKDWEKHIGYVFETRQQTTMEFPFMTPAAGLRFFQSVLVPEFSDTGEVETVLTISRDITEKKERDSMVSHELKTPVTSLKVSTQMLKKKLERDGNASLAEQLIKMDRQIDRLTNIIGNLMDTTRIEKGSMQVDRKSFNLNDLVKDVVDDVEETSSFHRITIRGSSKKLARGDSVRIGQVVTNLLTNAIRYSPKSPEIIVTISSGPTYATVGVQDFGIGIPGNQQKKIFDRFYRIKDIDRAFHMGLGLGLYISSEIVKQHKGKIWVKSKKGKGSTFFFTIPLH